jgi:hypothetical protein
MSNNIEVIIKSLSTKSSPELKKFIPELYHTFKKEPKSTFLKLFKHTSARNTSKLIP